MMVKNKKMISLIVVLFVFFSTIFSGCFFRSSIYEFEFKQDNIVINVGETKTIAKSDFDFKPDYISREDFTLSIKDNADETIIDIYGQKIKGKKEGKTKLVATTKEGNSAEVTIIVTNPIKKAELVSKDDLIQVLSYFEKPKQVKIDTVLNDGSILNTKYNGKYKWYVNDVLQNFSSSTFIFQPQTIGLYTITCKIDGYKQLKIQPVVVKIYRDFEASATVKGELVQETDNYSDIEFNVTITSDIMDDTPPSISWKVNDKIVSTDNKFVFTPKDAGIFNVTLFVNGQKQQISSQDNIKITIKGTPSLINNLRFDFDSDYKKPTLYWTDPNDINNYTILLTNLDNGIVKTYNTTSQFIILPDLPLSAHNYEFKVKSLDNEIFHISEYSQPLVFNKIPPRAIDYLPNDWLGNGAGHENNHKNRYITSDEELFEFYDYCMLFREQPVDKMTTLDTKFYMAYESQYSLQTLDKMAFNRSSYTGSYKTDLINVGNNIIKVHMEFNTVSYPSLSTDKSRSKRKQVDSLNVHFSNIGKEDVFPIDELDPIAVDTTDQLYRIVEMGYKPFFPTNNEAQKCYNYARQVLCSILDDNMTDYQKALAIYEWIMYRVVYDEVVVSDIQAIKDVNEALKYAVKCNAYYMEGVFDDSLAVCDGMSKAYSLLCNISGIECYKIVGSAGPQKEGHAWNKVKIDGEFYVVDCTWGDGYIDATIGGVQARYELATHDYFLLTDAQISDTHTEEVADFYPKTASTPLNYYDVDFVYKNRTMDFYLDNPNYQAEVDNLVDYIIDHSPNQYYTINKFGLNQKSAIFTTEINVSESLNKGLRDNINVYLKQQLSNKKGFFRNNYNYGILANDDKTHFTIMISDLISFK